MLTLFKIGYIFILTPLMRVSKAHRTEFFDISGKETIDRTIRDDCSKYVVNVKSRVFARKLGKFRTKF